MSFGEFALPTSNYIEFIDITANLQHAVDDSGVSSGVLIVHNPHTTAGITINEGADPDVQSDLINIFRQIVPADNAYLHREGNSPSHMMTTLTGSSVSVFIENGKIKLGTWQRIFFCEYDGPRSRKVWWKILAG
jgi:secondary thiamine-phosphate synthase enzyme